MDFEFNLPVQKSSHTTNPIYLKAVEVANITGMPVNRWLRAVKQHPWAIDRALTELRELSAHNKAAYFQWLFKKFKGEEKNGK